MDDRHLRALIGERHPLSSPAALRRAQDYLVDQFQRLGCEVTRHAFPAFGATYQNVVATIPAKAGGACPPPLIIAAHYDTVSGSPGADDNASALAVMLEVGCRLRDHGSNGEIRFVAFCLEEENLLGSLAYASWLRETDQPIRGAIVLECVGYARTEEGSQRKPPGVPVAVPSVGDFLGLVGNQTSIALVKAIEGAANKHVADLKTVSLVVPGNGELLPDTRRSDHAAFWQYGYPAVMLTDTAEFRNPHYHRPTDTLDTLDLSFMDKVARLITAAAMDLTSAEARKPVQ